MSKKCNIALLLSKLKSGNKKAVIKLATRYLKECTDIDQIMSAAELLGSGKKLQSAMNNIEALDKDMSGEGKISDALKKGWSKVKSFIQGKEKVKPRQVIDIILKIAQYAGVPGANVAQDINKGVQKMIDEGKAKKEEAKKEEAKEDIQQPESKEDKGSGINPGGGARLQGHGINPGGGKIKARGTKSEVWNGTAKRTAGGLRKEDLIKNKRGKIVSKKQSGRGQALAAKYGFKKK